MLSESSQLEGSWTGQEMKKRPPSPLQEWPSVSNMYMCRTIDYIERLVQHMHKVEVQPHPK